MDGSLNSEGSRVGVVLISLQGGKNQIGRVAPILCIK